MFLLCFPFIFELISCLISQVLSREIRMSEGFDLNVSLILDFWSEEMKRRFILAPDSHSFLFCSSDSILNGCIRIGGV